jgi:hypothetical protein
MTSTVFLLRLLGCSFLGVGASILIAQSHYRKVLRNASQEPAAFLLAAILPFVVGLSIVITNTLWATPAEIVVSVVGWMILLKGIIRLLAPEWAMKTTGSLGARYLSAWGIVVAIMGIGMLWLGVSA